MKPYETHRIKETELSLLEILNSEFSDIWHRRTKRIWYHMSF